MDRLWDFFEEFNELVFASDVDTHELVYMNRKARNVFEIGSQEELAGKMCYEYVQNNAFPCAFCLNDQLKPGQFYKWHHYNALLGKRVVQWDTLVVEGGRRYRIEIAVDISEEEKWARAVVQYQNMSMMLNNAVGRALQEPTPSKTINCLLHEVGHILSCDRVFICEINNREGVDNTYEWVAARVTPLKDKFQNIPVSYFENWKKVLLENQEIVINDLEDIREECPELCGLIDAQRVHSMVILPLFMDDTLIGFYGAENPTADFLETNITDALLGLLQTMGYFIVGALRRRELVKRLMDLSYVDQQTHVGNRRALAAYIKDLSPREMLHMGVVFCDVTGLKYINDTQGHAEGDRAIACASSCLQKIFEGEHIFRQGGDEFLVLCPEMDERTLQERVAQFHSCCKVNVAAGIACGLVTGPDARADIDTLVTKAEKAMYLDKERYYKSTGVERRTQTKEGWEENRGK